MIRRVINIDEEKCNGCGICVNACHEGAIGLVDGKAKLLRDDYCVVAALDLSVVARCVRTDQFMPDIQFGGRFFK